MTDLTSIAVLHEEAPSFGFEPMRRLLHVATLSMAHANDDQALDRAYERTNSIETGWYEDLRGDMRARGPHRSTSVGDAMLLTRRDGSRVAVKVGRVGFEPLDAAEAALVDEAMARSELR